MELHFVTGNKQKLSEVQDILGNHYRVSNIDIDLPELQTLDAEKIAVEKCKLAYSKEKKPVIVEDTSLYFNAFKSNHSDDCMPGPLIKHFMKTMSLTSITDLLHKFDDKTAYAQCIVAYMDENHPEPLTFKGIIHGKIVYPRGNFAFGWDPIFQPVNQNMTFGEMSSTEKNAISHRYIAFNDLKNFLSNYNNIF